MIGHRTLTKFLEKALLFCANLLYTVSCNPPLPNLITIVKPLQKVKFLLRESLTSSQKKQRQPLSTSNEIFWYNEVLKGIK